MSNIAFSPEQAEAAAVKIGQKGQEVDNTLKQLKNEIHGTRSWWQGQSADAFIGEFDSLQPNLQKLVECVEGISKQLKQVADIKRRSEQEMANQLRR
ncbi:WXG100 family type VII secretion target [Natranaerovirga hydrolytica]|uniref:ESAT-6-like protein n=1 Tax=Natranaerovirga hydrolytica TaxID=680378 RepID=A0A4V2PZP7_9FIRM|nr:WXG100 family type VII secretion target [Natranaerovirga hydrolytica]TCK90651.1 WXG100 family type VII secretion target [Natranaerovirga hydrolytica]